MRKSNLLADRLYQLRTEKRIRQIQLAKAIGVDAPMYSRIEKGNRKLKIEQLEILATELKVDVEELHSLWLADKMNKAVSESPKTVAERALSIVNNKLKQE